MTVFADLFAKTEAQEPVHVSFDTEVAFAGFLEIQVEAFQMFEKQRAEKRAKLLPSAKDELMVERKFKRASRLTGDERRANFYYGLQVMNDHSMETFGEPIPMDHLMIADQVVTSLLERMYGKDYDRKLASLLRLYEKDMFRSCTFISMPRRSGKTYMIAMIVAIYMYTQPKVKINVYSIGRRASGMFAAQVLSHLITLAGPSVRFAKKDQETVIVYNMYGLESAEGKSMLNSYPDSDDVSIIFISAAKGKSSQVRKVSFFFFFLSFSLRTLRSQFVAGWMRC